MTGEFIEDADVNIDNRFNEPYIWISFNNEGAKLFEQITGDNINRKLAIILDNNVYSAPIIRDKIPGGRAQITGSFTLEEAHDIAIALRAGSLPVLVKVIRVEHLTKEMLKQDK